MVCQHSRYVGLHAVRGIEIESILLVVAAFWERVADWGLCASHGGRATKGFAVYTPHCNTPAACVAARGAVADKATCRVNCVLQVLGCGVAQMGSLVADKYLRFDFTHSAAIKQPQLDQVEHLVNQVACVTLLRAE
jgi:hypothetical protein